MSRYPYIPHLVFNAGANSFTHVDFIGFFIQMFTQGIAAPFTHPKFMPEDVGVLSENGLGRVWQNNFFSHYVIFRCLELQLTSYSRDARVIWTSSVEASPKFLVDFEDWQLVKAARPYGTSKYHIEIVASLLERKSLSNGLDAPKRVHHIVTHPGVCATDTEGKVIGPFLVRIKIMVFYVAPLLGS
ncbi:hypothetical protein FISHEDRAFT_76822 [Fistulina hepatica ATCC 64428]|uniref:NAD(P)-binding protein n=1 Tax=Fistulina hepatica ATCC 64428 TaxID=1128425 RepID=A0A0D7A272_9AGAR|nr:hypothetical protein FISHEDRAFT_76822 [Fistulina hepatica ATCC 64428]